jgi:hypothetical protein
MPRPEKHIVTIKWNGSKFTYEHTSDIDPQVSDGQLVDVKRTDTVDWTSSLEAFAIHFRDNHTPCDRRPGPGKLEKGHARKGGKIEGAVRRQAIIGPPYKYFVAAYVNGEIQTDDPDMIVYE